MLTFERDATFVANTVTTRDSVERGKAGAVSNVGSGSIWFKGKLIVQESIAEVSFQNVKDSSAVASLNAALPPPP